MKLFDRGKKFNTFPTDQFACSNRILGRVAVESMISIKQPSEAKMQLVEISQTISQKSSVLLMDEPTASLTPHDTKNFSSLLQKLK
jgi:ribose transport system ATP-binding protein